MYFNKIVCVLFLNIIVQGQQWTNPDEFKSRNLIKYKNVNNKNMNYFNPSSPYTDALEAVFGIGIRLQFLLQQSAEAKRRNFLVSPISMAVTVGELLLGARGKLRKYLADLLVIDNDNVRMELEHPVEDRIPLMYMHEQLSNLLKDLQYRGDLENTYILETASAMFLQPGFNLSEQFQDKMSKYYETSIIPVNFSTDPLGSFNFINDWGRTKTRDRIPQIIPVPLPRASVAVLVNAIYFKADWETPFSDELSAVGQFKISPKESVNVTFLRGQIDIPYVRNDVLNCSMIVLPYKDKKFSMYLMLPDENNGKEYDITELIFKLRAKDLYDLINQTEIRSVRVIIPKINLSNTISLLDPLKKYKSYKEDLEKMPIFSSRYKNKNENKLDTLDEKIEIYKELNDNETLDINVGIEQEPVDLSGASMDPRFRLTDIIQQMSLAINEKGTEAAAITASTISLSGGVKLFNANRPFLFFIRHEMTEATLFWGTIVNPSP